MNFKNENPKEKKKKKDEVIVGEGNEWSHKGNWKVLQICKRC